MPHSFFQLKQFTVWHDKCAMKVGTDGVLLGAWAPATGVCRILDIGTGTGLVALMLAQRCASDTRITALEIDESAAQQARENVKSSPWKERIEVLNSDFRNFKTVHKFDVIVSNPPYFIHSLACENTQRNTARHDTSLTCEELVAGAAKLLSAKGTFTVVLPTDIALLAKEIATKHNLHPIRQLNVITKPGGIPKRTLLTFSFSVSICQEEELVIELARHQYSQEYIALTQAYYLRM